MRAARANDNNTDGGDGVGRWMAALQMHGTGTPLGDPIEVGAACAVSADDVAACTWATSMPPLTLGATKVYKTTLLKYLLP